jgi:hypothetical protein
VRRHACRLHAAAACTSLSWRVTGLCCETCGAVPCEQLFLITSLFKFRSKNTTYTIIFQFRSKNTTCTIILSQFRSKITTYTTSFFLT